MPIVTLTDASSSAFAVPSSPSPGDVPDMFSRARRRAALRSARPILTSRTRTVAGSKPNTFCEKTKNTSTRSSPCSCNSNDLGESGRMNVRDSPRAVRYVPAKSSTFSPLSPQRIARKLQSRLVFAFVDLARTKQCYLFFAVSTAFTATAPFVPGSLTYSNFGAGACGGGGRFVGLSDPAPAVRGNGGTSSDRRAKALVKMRGRKRECDDPAEGGWVKDGDGDASVAI